MASPSVQVFEALLRLTPGGDVSFPSIPRSSSRSASTLDEPRGQRGEAEADHIGPAEVGDHIALDQRRAQLLRPVQGERDMGAPPRRLPRRRDAYAKRREPRVRKRDRQLGQRAIPFERIASMPAEATSRTPS
jgi:hypothetical protein